MDIKDVTIEMLQKSKGGPCRIVPVFFQPSHGILFLVEDVHCPQVPGYPAIPLCEVKEGLKKAYDLIEATYKRCNYKPIYHDRKEFYFQGLQTALKNEIRRS